MRKSKESAGLDGWEGLRAEASGERRGRRVQGD